MVVSIFFWNLTSFLEFFLTILIPIILWILIFEYDYFRNSLVWTITALFLSFIVLIYYTLALANNYQVATGLDKAIIYLLYIIFGLMILYRFYLQTEKARPF